MSKNNDLNLSESTLESLREYVDDFGMNVDDVVLKLINENKSLKESLGQDFVLSGYKEAHHFKDYVNHKLHKGKILVTHNG
uniref:hypothetical protein n=1 Tax=Klebsiella pneumoniae TaxID=573 RepID=UPI000AA1554D